MATLRFLGTDCFTGNTTGISRDKVRKRQGPRELILQQQTKEIRPVQ